MTQNYMVLLLTDYEVMSLTWKCSRNGHYSG